MSACQRCQASSVELGMTYCPRPRFFSCPSFAICEHILMIPGTVQQRIRRVHGAARGGAGRRRLADIHSIDDRLDHDVDELMA